MTQIKAKAGDHVKCVCASASFNKLTTSTIYTVAKVYEDGGIDLVETAGRAGTWSSDRFVVIA